MFISVNGILLKDITTAGRAVRLIWPGECLLLTSKNVKNFDIATPTLNGSKQSNKRFPAAATSQICIFLESNC